MLACGLWKARDQNHLHAVICDKQLRPLFQTIVTNIHDKLIKGQNSIFNWNLELELLLIVEQQLQSTAACQASATGAFSASDRSAAHLNSTLTAMVAAGWPAEPASADMTEMLPVYPLMTRIRAQRTK